MWTAGTHNQNYIQEADHISIEPSPPRLSRTTLIFRFLHYSQFTPKVVNPMQEWTGAAGLVTTTRETYLTG